MAPFAKVKQPGGSLLTSQSGGFDLVLGGGGIKGFGHIGVLHALEERRVPIKRIFGVSVGSLVAALYSNGRSATEIENMFFRQLPERYNPMLWLKMLTPMDAQSLMFGSIWDLVPVMAEFLSDEGLKPNKHLVAISYDVVERKPVVFSGENCDLAVALAASCALPGVFRPVRPRGGHHLLVDGALYHRNPTDFCQGPAIVSRLGMARQMPRELLTPVDLWFHLREIYIPYPTQRGDVDDKANILIHLDTPDVAGLSFGRSNATLLSMVENGYRTALNVLDKAISEGRIPAPRA